MSFIASATELSGPIAVASARSSSWRSIMPMMNSSSTTRIVLPRTITDKRPTPAVLSIWMVDRWGDQACTGESCSQRAFKGSLTVEGDSATLLFRDIANPGRGLHDALHGHVESREGKPAIVFGKSVIQFTEGPAETRELIF